MIAPRGTDILIIIDCRKSSPLKLATLNWHIKKLGKKVNFRQPSLLSGGAAFVAPEKRRSISEMKCSSLDNDGVGGEERRDSSGSVTMPVK
jgi:hypothetical protein